MQKKNSIKIIQCKECGELFTAPRTSHDRLCSDECRRTRDNCQRRLRKLHPELYPKVVKCKVCHLPFVKKHNECYCSEPCKIVGAREMARLKKRRYRKAQELLNVQVKGWLPQYRLDWARKREIEIELSIKTYKKKILGVT